MYLAADEDLTAVTQMARSVGIDLLSPASKETETSGTVPDAVWKALLETGLTAPLSETLGGGGIPGVTLQMAAVESLAYGDAAITLMALWSGAPSLLISLHGTAEQHEALIGSDSDLESRGSFALYEGFGRGASELQTTVSVNKDEVRVVGQKVAVPFASTAEGFVVIGVDSSDRSLRAVIVPRVAEGITVTQAKATLALRAAGLASVSFDVTVPAANLLDSSGLQITVERLRLLVASAQTGMAQRAIEYAADYATQRIAFGQPIASFQGISFPLAEAYSRTEQARLEILDAASQMTNGSHPDDVSAAVSAAVAYASENAAEATRHAVQVLGGHGFMTEYPVEQWYRTAAFLSVLDFDPLASSFQPAY